MDYWRSVAIPKEATMRNLGLLISILLLAAFASWAQQTAARNPQNGTELPGASQHINGGQRERELQAEERQQTHPTLVGCVVNSGKSQFFLTEQRSGTQYRLQASPEQLKDHVNHLVEVVGKPAHPEGAAKSVAGRDEQAFEVSGIQDLAPTCGAAH
jgi:hypothetical protein